MFVGVLAITLAIAGSTRAMAQPATGPSGPSAGGTPPPQPNRVAFTRESLPQMLKQLGYTVTEKSTANGALYWQIVTQSENWTFTVQVLPMVNQDKITSFLLSSDLGRKVNPQAGAKDVLKVMQWNHEMAFLMYFGYNAQTGCITAQRPYMFADASLDELRFIFNDYFKNIRDTHAVWNPLGNAAPAPADNGKPTTNDKPAPAPEAPANVSGTTWTGSENLQGYGKLTFVFRAGGNATMIDARGESQGTWSQNGADVTLRFNGCVYQGRINGQSLSGNGRITEGAQAGQTWTFQITRQKN